jgi:acyl-CoA dehydrogenase
MAWDFGTEPEFAERFASMRAFVDRELILPGMEAVRDVPTMPHPDVEYGRPGNDAESVFRDCRVPADHLIGRPGDGFVLAQKRPRAGRIHHSMRWLGQAQRSFSDVVEPVVR